MAAGGNIPAMAGEIREFEGLRVRVNDVVYMPGLDSPPPASPSPTAR